MKKSDHPAGFTIVELAVVLAIAAILAAVAIPAISTWWPSMQLSSAARDLFGTFQRAQVEASKRGRPCTVVFNAVDAHGQQFAYFLFQEVNNPGARGVFDPGDLFISGETNLPASVNFDFATAQPLPLNAAGQFFITFLPSTLPVDAANLVRGGAVSLRNTRGQIQTVTINNVGNLTIR